MKYEERVVVYIDILGFKELLNETIDKNKNDAEEKIDALIEAYQDIRDIWDLDKGENNPQAIKKPDKKITIFSDSIVISFPIGKPSEIFYTLLDIKLLTLKLISRGILCRGAMSYGKLLHNDKYIFGPALVEAYLLESRAANYPRVILDRSVIDLAGRAKSNHHTEEEETQYVEDLLEKDLDGMYYVDYFAKAQEELDSDFPKYITKLGDKIREGMQRFSNPNNADKKVKYIWMKEKYNRMVKMCKRQEILEKMDVEDYNFYSSLKPINPRKDLF